MTTKGENHCIAMHFIIYTRAYRYRLLVMIITEHPAYPYLATDVARCRDGDVSRVSLKYDAAECSPGLLSMEWYPSLDAAKCSPRLVTPSCSWSFSTNWFFHAGTRVLQRHVAPSLHLFLFLWETFLLPLVIIIIIKTIIILIIQRPLPDSTLEWGHSGSPQ